MRTKLGWVGGKNSNVKNIRKRDGCTEDADGDGGAWKTLRLNRRTDARVQKSRDAATICPVFVGDAGISPQGR